MINPWQRRPNIERCNLTAEDIQTQADRPLLTIAIPTYNREGYLRGLLSVLFDQLIHESRVELFISDNASRDHTSALVEEFRKRGLAIRCIRNETNIGPDANFLQCFEESRGKYVWIFGDDDVIVPGAVAAILSCLHHNEYDLVYVNSFPIRGPQKFTPIVGRISHREYEDVIPFVKRINISFTFISTNIVNKDRVQAAVPASFAALVGTNLVQLAWIFAALNTFTRGLYINQKLVGARVDNTGGYNVASVFGSKLNAVTKIGLHSERLRRLIISGTLQRFWPALLIFLRNSTGSFEHDQAQTRTLTSEFKDNPRYWLFVYPILVLPPFLGSAWFFCIRVVNFIDKTCGYLL
jgi:abequosyltransferase